MTAISRISLNRMALCLVGGVLWLSIALTVAACTKTVPPPQTRRSGSNVVACFSKPRKPVAGTLTNEELVQFESRLAVYKHIFGKEVANSVESWDSLTYPRLVAAAGGAGGMFEAVGIGKEGWKDRFLRVLAEIPDFQSSGGWDIPGGDCFVFKSTFVEQLDNELVAQYAVSFDPLFEMQENLAKVPMLIACTKSRQATRMRESAVVLIRKYLRLGIVSNLDILYIVRFLPIELVDSAFVEWLQHLKPMPGWRGDVNAEMMRAEIIAHASHCTEVMNEIRRIYP